MIEIKVRTNNYTLQQLHQCVMHVKTLESTTTTICINNMARVVLALVVALFLTALQSTKSLPARMEPVNVTCVNQTCTKTCQPSNVNVWGDCCNNQTVCEFDPVFRDYRCIPPGQLC
eukprot:m.98391 g.98391  ORF g.98391 m.98391 type:complete len:117 (-) comp13633_c0_seq1:3673-4023(-)